MKILIQKKFPNTLIKIKKLMKEILDKIKVNKNIWYDEEIIGGLVNLKNFIINLKTAQKNIRGYNDSIHIILLLIDKVINILEEEHFNTAKRNIKGDS